jgi:hypothetical protein
MLPKFHIAKLLIFGIPFKPFDVKVLRDLFVVHESPELSCVDSNILSNMNLFVSVGYLGCCFFDHPIFDGIIQFIEIDIDYFHFLNLINTSQNIANDINTNTPIGPKKKYRP